MNQNMPAKPTKISSRRPGFRPCCKVSKQLIDRDAFMQLEFAKTGRDRSELWRCQWRPFETHTNKNCGPPGFEMARFDRQSHHHPFSENFMPSERRMKGRSLPIALPIDPDPKGFSEFVAFCGECFKIKNINLVVPPHLTGDLFWTPDG
jgi:hypothetical protein